MICTPIFQTTTKERRNMLDNNKTINELVQERMDAKPWYKKLFIIPDKYEGIAAIVLLILAIISLVMSTLMIIGTIPEDTGIISNLRIYGLFILSLFLLYNMIYKRRVRKNVCREVMETLYDAENMENAENIEEDSFKDVGAEWDKLAPDEEHAIEFAHRHINDEPQKYTGKGKFSGEYQIAHSGVDINKRYRQGRPNSADEKVAERFSENTTDTDLVLYRGVDDQMFKLMERSAECMQDCDFYEKGFLATSLIKRHEKTCKNKLRIYVPAGSHVVYLGNVNGEKDYYEVVVQRGAKLKIVSTDSRYINCKLIETA